MAAQSKQSEDETESSDSSEDETESLDSSEETPNKEPIPSGATILLNELEDLIKANFQFYAGRPIDKFEFNAFNSNNRKLSILAETIEQKKIDFTIEDTKHSLKPLDLNTEEKLEKFENDIRSSIKKNGIITNENVEYTESNKLNSLQSKLNVNEKDRRDEGLFKIEKRTYIRLPMSADGNCMYYSILIADYLESFLNNRTPSIVDIYGNPYITLYPSNANVSEIFKQSMEEGSHNLIVNGIFNLDIVTRKFKQDLYRSWFYRLKDFKNNSPELTLGIGYFFKESEVITIQGKDASDKEGPGNSKYITELLSSSREETYIKKINNGDLNDYFNFVFNDGYYIDEQNEEPDKYLLGGEDGIEGDRINIIELNKDKDEFNEKTRIWATATELLFILIRFRNLKISVYDIDPRMPNQGSYTFDISSYGIVPTTGEEIKQINLLYTGMHYDVLVDTAILDKMMV